MTATLSDLDALLDELLPAITTVDTDVKALIAAVESHPAAADFTSELGKVQASIDALGAVHAETTTTLNP